MPVGTMGKALAIVGVLGVTVILVDIVHTAKQEHILADAESDPVPPADYAPPYLALIAEADDANSTCRGTGGPDMEPACARRSDLHTQLEELGWCYGEGAKSGAEAVWAPCRTDQKSVHDRMWAKIPEPEPSREPDPPPEDPNWYVVATKEPDCVPAKLAFGLDTPEQVVQELNSRGGRYTYLKRDESMIAIIEPLGLPIFFVRGRADCRYAHALALAAGR